LLKSRAIDQLEGWQFGLSLLALLLAHAPFHHKDMRNSLGQLILPTFQMFRRSVSSTGKRIRLNCGHHLQRSSGFFIILFQRRVHFLNRLGGDILK